MGSPSRPDVPLVTLAHYRYIATVNANLRMNQQLKLLRVLYGDYLCDQYITRTVTILQPGPLLSAH
jgi:hypothetical protein